jgi:dTDP-4-dehydrorhamnose 3,5-epimerase
MFETRRLAIPDLIEILPKRYGDHRGFFSETWSATAFAEVGIDIAFVQDNHSLSAAPGVLRGLHYQVPPFAQAKLVRVTRGAAFDVAVDIRHGSPTFGRHAAVTLSAEAWNQILLPEGFAHGLLTLEPNTEVQYKVSAPYAPDHERAIAWDDPDLAIAWPALGSAPTLSEKDARAPRLTDVAASFHYRG